MLVRLQQTPAKPVPSSTPGCFPRICRKNAASVAEIYITQGSFLTGHTTTVIVTLDFALSNRLLSTLRVWLSFVRDRFLDPLDGLILRRQEINHALKHSAHAAM
jgi:hypothetical protein